MSFSKVSSRGEMPLAERGSPSQGLSGLLKQPLMASVDPTDSSARFPPAARVGPA